MPGSWDSVRDRLRARYSVYADEKDWVGVVVPVTDGPAGPVHEVRVERGTAFGTDWVAVLAAIGPARQLSSAAALEANARMALGAVAVVNGVAYARAAMAIEGPAPDQLDQAIVAMAREAVRWRAAAGASTESAGVFKAFEE